MKLADALAIIREREAWELAEGVQKWAEAQFDDDERQDLPPIKRGLANLYREVFGDENQ